MLKYFFIISLLSVSFTKAYAGKFFLTPSIKACSCDVLIPSLDDDETLSLETKKFRSAGVGLALEQMVTPYLTLGAGLSRFTGNDSSITDYGLYTRTSYGTYIRPFVQLGLSRSYYDSKYLHIGYTNFNSGLGIDYMFMKRVYGSFLFEHTMSLTTNPFIKYIIDNKNSTSRSIISLGLKIRV